MCYSSVLATPSCQCTAAAFQGLGEDWGGVVSSALLALISCEAWGGATLRWNFARKVSDVVCAILPPHRYRSLPVKDN